LKPKLPLTQRLSLVSARLRPDPIKQALVRQQDDAARLIARAQRSLKNDLEKKTARLNRAASLLDAYSYQGVLARGYALVTDDAGHVVRSKDTGADGDRVTLTFADGTRGAVLDKTSGTPAPAPAKAQKKSAKTSSAKQDDKSQMGLF